MEEERVLRANKVYRHTGEHPHLSATHICTKVMHTQKEMIITEKKPLLQHTISIVEGKLFMNVRLGFTYRRMRYVSKSYILFAQKSFFIFLGGL